MGCVAYFEGSISVILRREMDEQGTSHQQVPTIQRVRCRQCGLPLVQFYQEDILYTLQDGEGESTSQPIPAYLYRTLTDPTPLLFCPGCHAPLSPTGVTVVTGETRVFEEKKPKQP